MLLSRDSRITRTVIGIFFLIVLGYAYFELHGILYGPTIEVTSGTNVAYDPMITITGTASRISSLSMNGQAVSVTEQGAFAEPYLLALGLNRIVLEARDKYGRNRKEVIQVVYSPSADSTHSTGSGQAESPHTATSTPDTVVATTTASSTVAQ
jgi:hypothetical protein